MKNHKWLILSLLLLAILPGKALEAQVVNKGIIDLRSFNQDEEFIVVLNGEWEFYWNKLYHPYDFNKSNNLKPDLYGHVPSYWTDYSTENNKIEGKGYATYKATLILPEGMRNALGFDISVFDSSYDIYLNDEYITSNGIPGRSEDEEVPEYRRNFFRYIPKSDTIDIIINVSNFSHRRGGFWLPMRVGTFPLIQGKLANNWAFNWTTISLLGGFSLFFLFFYLLNPSERVLGFFAVGTIGLTLRPLFTSHFLINQLANLSWEWVIRFEYLALYTSLIGWYWFVKELYPNRIFGVITRILSAMFFIAFLLTIFLPVRIFSYATLGIYPAILFMMAYSAVKSTLGIIEGKYLNIAYLGAFLILIFGGIHDIFVSLGRSENTVGYLLTFLVIVFIFIQAALLMYRWVKAFYEKERLSTELENLNRNLELKVAERTVEIEKRNAEIKKQNKMIEEKNRQLSETINIKNKMFSVVAHDLRSPVVNILYMLNLLKEKEYREKYDTFANTSIEYAQRVISLLENMLVWGRGQENKIIYSPSRLDLSDIILTNLSIFKESADKKEISVSFTQVGSPFAFIDRDLIDIIIRNLLSNAVKYTYRGGRISILLREKKENGGSLLLKVCDNGTGIPPGKINELFSDKSVESAPGTENEKGTGLGLKLVHELVLINKGTIEVESKEGEGSCFLIYLPCQ